MKANNILIVFDWDMVVFNTKILRQVRARALKEFKYSKEHILNTARAAVESRGGYSPHSHAQLLVRGFGHDPEVVAQAMYSAIDKHPRSFVFPDAMRTIESLKREKRHFDILTAGHTEFQEYKIVRSGLKPLFRNIHIVRPGPRVPANKINILKRLAKEHGQVVFLDDRADTIEMVKDHKSLQGKVLPILVLRKKEKPPRGVEVLRRLSLRGIEKIAIHNGFQPY
jgi:FMN phosphatase YigB (HAD superfamily)